MHIAYNGWFWDQPNNGSGMYLRKLGKVLFEQRAYPQMVKRVGAALWLFAVFFYYVTHRAIKQFG